MTAQLAYATLAHFALAAVETQPESRLAVYKSLAEIAARMNLEDERAKASEAVEAIRTADNTQLTFERLIQAGLSKEEGK